MLSIFFKNYFHALPIRLEIKVGIFLSSQYLVSMIFFAWPWIMVDLARVGCDLINFFFVYDEYTDIEDASGASALANTVICAIKNPEAKSDNLHFVGEMARQ